VSVDYQRCYKVLHLAPGATWEELRRQYKHLVQHCHPDRFQGDAEALKKVELDLRKLNAAYKALADYHKRHKRLPLAGASQHTDWEFQNTSDLRNRSEELHSEGRWSVRDFPVSRWLILAFPAGLVVLVIGLFSTNHTDEEALSPGAEKIEVARVSARPPQSPPRPAMEKPQLFFEYGDPWMTVLEVQGEPSSRTENTWFYGKSRVEFKDGRVVGWQQQKGNPLYVRGRLPGKTGAEKQALIRLGDSSERVLRIQGRPLMKTERRWEYGPSFIEFRDGKVIRWHSSVMRPLAVDQADTRKD